ncbi:hypothetical protein BT93_L0089 [Corymbia citriodora subsp. variegata]|uniref:UTP--glucose-1-phosphate uridylyltransferase n=1 Tax=Corymbia citriodora subsp. variegata TaxID=360336 RepID=A0A8T0CUW1_CORYI|nr:hypothetical protein BT93_L0089 [Corymbia citriodora subsp. variegata]
MTLHSIVIQKLLSTNAHLGRRVATHHFKLFTYGRRNGMTIIDSDKTLICLRNACDFIASLVRHKGRFMFVNTNPLFDEIVEQMTRRIGCYSPSGNALWRTGGFLTNSCSPKKFRSRNKKICFGPTQPPDCLVVMDTERKSSVIQEAEKLQIPVVALVDSSMPWECYKKITYPIPANDSVQFVYLFCNMITKTFLLEQKKLAAVKDRLGIALVAASAPKPEAREEVPHIEESKSESDSGTEFAKIQVPIIPYERLAPFPEDVAETKKLLDKLVVLKLNGALGTKMGFDGPKSTIEIGNGMTILGLTATQIEHLNSKYGCNVPLLLINSSRTHDATLKVWGKYSQSNIDFHAFELNQNSQLRSSGEQSSNNELVHANQGAVIVSLMRSGMLDVLLSQGKEYVFVVNSDNAGAIIDPKILNHLIQNKVECCMEVRPTTSIDVNGNFVNFEERKFQLAEIAQPSERLSEKFKLLDTKNMWINLNAIKTLVDTDALKWEVDAGSSLMRETATSSIIQFFENAIGISVPSSRYFPLNATSDLLLLQSDLYSAYNGVLIRNAARTNPKDPSIELGPEFDKLTSFASRFKSIPGVVELDSLKVAGDVWFGNGIKLKGNVSIVARPGMRIEIPDGVVLENKLINGPEDI